MVWVIERSRKVLQLRREPSTEVNRVAHVLSLSEGNALLLPEIKQVTFGSEFGRFKHCVPADVQEEDIEEVHSISIRAERVCTALVESYRPNLLVEREILSVVAKLTILRRVADYGVLSRGQRALDTIHDSSDLISRRAEGDRV